MTEYNQGTPNAWQTQPAQQMPPQQMPMQQPYGAPMMQYQGNGMTLAGQSPAQRFTFTGDVGDYFVVSLLSYLLTVCTLGLAAPWAACMVYKWRAEHTYLDGHQLKFTGTGGQLAGKWFLTLLLIIVTLGIYSLWVVPRFTKYQIEHTTFA
ncbi:MULTISPECIES: DUF898 family protein [unclassified Luteococcus]|uniref:DUF898 family protein n=1 Tax=unclassified Luteococcus TaxID=2639923 RepID=UPI00313DFDC4